MVARRVSESGGEIEDQWKRNRLKLITVLKRERNRSVEVLHSGSNVPRRSRFLTVFHERF
jgi:hypothetical protein